MNDESQATPVTMTSPVPHEDSAASQATADPPSRPSERLLVGTQRAAEADTPAAEAEALRPKPVHQVTVGEAPRSQKHYPPPNVRAQLSAEEQAEFDAMLGGADVTEVLDSGAAAAPEELAPETKVRGRVTRVHADSVFVDLGHHREGVVPLKQFEPKRSPVAPGPVAAADEAATPVDADAAPGAAYAPAVGEELDLVVVRADEGVYEVKLPSAAVDIGNWEEVEVGQIVEVTITSANKGGLECVVAGIRGFMPMGQISMYRVENAAEYVGQRLAAVITEANRAKRNLILSHRAVMERERSAKRDQLLADLAPGQLRDGVVRSLRDFGAFVDLGGVDGMIHVSKLGWERISHPRDVLTEGQTIKVKIEKVDRETGKVALSYRETTENPWDKAEQKYAVGATVRGKVSKVMDFGAFVRLEPGIEGMIHISELDHKRVHRTGDVVSEGEEVETKVLAVDRGKQRIALSLKALKAAPAREQASREHEPETPEPPRPERLRPKNLKGGVGAPTGGEKFGLKW